MKVPSFSSHLGYERLYKTLASSDRLSKFDFNSLKYNIDSINPKSYTTKDNLFELDSPTLFSSKIKSEPKASLRGSQRMSSTAPRFSVHQDILKTVIERNGKTGKHHMNFEQLSKHINSKLQKFNYNNNTAETYVTTDFTEQSKNDKHTDASISYNKLKQKVQRSTLVSKSEKNPNRIKLKIKSKLSEVKEKNKLKASVDILKSIKNKSLGKDEFRKTYNTTFQSNLFSQTTAADTIKKGTTTMYNTLNNESPRDSFYKLNINEENKNNEKKKENISIEDNLFTKTDSVPFFKPGILGSIMKNSRNPLKFELTKSTPSFKTFQGIANKSQQSSGKNIQMTELQEINPYLTKQKRVGPRMTLGLDESEQEEKQQQIVSSRRSAINVPPPINSKPLFKNCVNMNKYLINDFKIGSSLDPSKSSKKKYSMTTQMFEYIDKTKKDKIKKARQAFEIEKYGEIIIEENHPQRDNIEYNEDNLIGLSESEKLKIEMKKLDERKTARIFEKSKRIADLIQDISNSSYEEFEEDSMINFVSPVSEKNLERIIRVRNIVKTGKDLLNDNLGIEDMKNFRNQREVNDQELILALKSLGPPSFLKTRFKSSTVSRYNVVNGKFFGCPS